MNFQNYGCKFPSPEYNDHYLEDIKEAIKNKQPYSWIRIGDGEIAFLEQGFIYADNQILSRYGWGTSNYYCGSKLPNIPLRDRLIEAIKNSTLVGVFYGDPATMNIFEKIGLAPQNITYAFDNVFLPMNAKFVNFISKERILLVGKDSPIYAEKMKELINADIVATVPISDYSEIDRCMNDMEKYDYTLALVSAGVNAKAICYEMTKRKNSVFLDMGHAWDNAFHAPGMYDEYFLIPVWQDRYYPANSLVITNDKLYRNTSGQTINSYPENDERWIVVEYL